MKATLSELILNLYLDDLINEETLSAFCIIISIMSEEGVIDFSGDKIKISVT